jgi:hypothetical protein
VRKNSLHPAIDLAVHKSQTSAGGERTTSPDKNIGFLVELQDIAVKYRKSLLELEPFTKRLAQNLEPGERLGDSSIVTDNELKGLHIVRSNLFSN